MPETLTSLRKRAQVSSLLSPPTSNPKIKKSMKVGVLTAALHLAPANLSGFEVCPGRSPGCTHSCLHTAGNPAHMVAKSKGRIAKTQLLMNDRGLFRELLMLELAAHARAAERKNMIAAVRLNATSDLRWYRMFPEIFTDFPSIEMYDYSKLLHKVRPANYNLTFSLAEDNLDRAVQAFETGMNVAVVFAKVPETFQLGPHLLPVIAGDDHDHRPLDPPGVIVGLKAKGLARKDTSGFVQR